MLSIEPADDTCFALLDDSSAGAAIPQSRLYTAHVGTLSCRRAGDLDSVLERMQGELRNGRHAVAMFSYELGERLQGIVSDDEPATSALAQILLFNDCRRLTASEVETWMAQQQTLAPESTDIDRQPSGIANVRANVDEAEFNAAISRIHAYIEAGDTYQVNYTYRLNFDAYGSLHALYSRLRTRQPVPYGALIRLPDGGAVLSLSPELFVRHKQRHLITQPMKGTLAAHDPASDADRSVALAGDPKGRAENLMIVDLLRNDMGRIARLGTVKVPQLFQVQRHGTVLQMTSTITAELRPEISLSDLFRSLYPCGSITGAPKHRTMQIIRELEPAPRGLYTGALGWFDTPAPGEALGEFCLSVPIRTLVLEPESADGVRAGEMGVGAGIVHDSTAADEYAECKLKARFLTGLESDFELFETIHATRAAGCRHLDLHLQRLSASAAYFGFACDAALLRAACIEASAGLRSDAPHRLRLSLRHDGKFAIQTAELAPWATPARLLLATEPMEAGNLFLRHKTTIRARYDAAWRTAEAGGAFDMLFFNTRGELTEGARSNVFLKLDGRWQTPPLSAGLLPGIMRALILADPKWNAGERTLTLQDLHRAEEVMVCNALRGFMPATMDCAAQYDSKI